MDQDNAPVLVMGATGYVGGRLTPLLLERGHRVRAAVRSIRKLQGRPWGRHPNLEIVRADALDTEALTEAMRGCRALYYLVHSIKPGAAHYASLDRRLAYSAVRAALAAKLPRIIYFTGLGGDPEHLSEQLRSRYEVGEILSLAAPLTQLRTPLVLGSGGASFEMIRALCEHLRVLVAPRWANTLCQPIAIADVLEYLAGCLEKPETIGRTYEIGGPDVLTYKELFRLYAEVAGLPRRFILTLPTRSTKLSIWWINLVTPMSVSLIKPLVERMRTQVICHDTRIREILPIPLRSCREAVAEALDNVRRHDVPSSCFDAGSTRLPQWAKGQAAPGARVFRDTFSVTLAGPPETAWNVVKRIGGDTGWYFGDFLWRMRGFVDELCGGPGLCRGRRSPDTVAMGDFLDFWRVVEVDEPRRLLLRAEMRAPGEALLEFSVTPLPDGGTELRMTPSFEPRGLAGMLYWWCIAPSHHLLFRPMLKHMARAAGARILRGPVSTPG